ncbi:MAG: hypothetical protein CUN56_07385 [Phototrophicales bacterium]|nr:MAG: hypothetical protein CUN56_07385 [Phototrophicales bacterium]RMG73221.1 MAG: hypothetical protein D6711_11320 [Chloroflexota bacterium]
MTMIWFLLAMLLLGGGFFPPGMDIPAVVEAAPYSARFAELGFNRPLSFFFYDLTNDELLAGVDIEKQLPMVSAIKGPILMYFLTHVPADVWNSVPVMYWHARAADVPAEYGEAWQTHHLILRDLYRMIVYSDNYSTGNVLAYAYEYTGLDHLNPIEAFNAWSETTIGISPESGMRQWDQGETDNPAYIDHRFDNRTTLIRGVPRFYNNTISALDLARYYAWLYDQMGTDLFDQAVALMSVVEGFPGFLEQTALRLGGVPVSKDGFVGPGDENNAQNEYLTADAGLILLDDRALLVVSMSVNGGDKMEAIYNEVEIIARQRRGELFWQRDLDYITWMRSAAGPYGENTLSTEALYFILEYMIDIGQRPIQGEAFSGDVTRFEEAREVWLAVFPGDVIPIERNAVQNRVLQARYGVTNENLYELALELGLVEGGER